MIETLKHLSKHSIIYGLGGMLSRLLGLVLLPIYTRYLTPADYGILSLLVITNSIATTVTTLGLGRAMTREIVYQNSDERTVVSTTFYVLMGESMVFFGALIAFSPQLCGLIFGSPEHTHLLRFIFLMGFLKMFDVVVITRLRIRAQSALYSALAVARFLAGAMLNIYFIVVLKRGVEGLVTSGVITAALFAAVYLALLIRHLQPSFSLPILRRMLSFGMPLIPVSLSFFLMRSIDRYFLQHYSTAADVGLYSIGCSIGMVMYLAIGAFRMAWIPQKFAIAKQSKQSDAEHQFARILTYYLIVLGFGGVILSVFAREVLLVLTTPKFYGAYTVVPLITLSGILFGARMVTNIGIPVRNKTKFLPPIIIGSAMVNMALNYVLIPPYGMMGAAWATVISYLVMFIAQITVNLHFWYIRYEYGRIAKLVLAWALIYGSSLLVQTPIIVLNGGLKLVLVATYPLLLYVFRFYEKQELIVLKRLFQSGMYRVRIWNAGP
jgi:O-antigen/teichoic acid export membrane protein